MSANTHLINGTIFNTNARALVMPVSTAGVLSVPFQQGLKEIYNGLLPRVFTRKDFGEIDISSGGFQRSQYPYEQLTIIFAYCVDGETSSYEAIANIALSIARLCRERSGLKEVACPLLGTGAGKLNPIQVFKILSSTFSQEAPEDCVLNLFVADRKIFNLLQLALQNPGDAMTEREVCISYAWGGESEQIVDLIDVSLKKKGFHVVRDKKEIKYKGSIKNFMDRVSNGRFVIIVISDKYLKSDYCMYEIVKLSQNGQFHDRIFPIVLEDTNFYSPLDRIKYVKYWENKIKTLNKSVRIIDDLSVVTVIEKELKNYREILNSINNILDILKDMNTFSVEIHKNNNFEELFKLIEKKVT